MKPACRVCIYKILTQDSTQLLRGTSEGPRHSLLLYVPHSSRAPFVCACIHAVCYTDPYI